MRRKLIDSLKLQKNILAKTKNSKIHIQDLQID